MNKTTKNPITPCCLTCYETIQHLLQQIQQLQSHQNSLKSLNNTLLETLNSKQDHHSRQLDLNWKQKYQEEVRRSFRLQKRLIEVRLQEELRGQQDGHHQIFEGLYRQRKNSVSLRRINDQQLMSSTAKFRSTRQQNMKKMQQLINNVINNRHNFQQQSNSHHPSVQTQSRTVRKNSQINSHINRQQYIILQESDNHNIMKHKQRQREKQREKQRQRRYRNYSQSQHYIGNGNGNRRCKQNYNNQIIVRIVKE